MQVKKLSVEHLGCRGILVLALCFLFLAPAAAQELLNYPLDTINGEEVYKYRVERSIGLYRIGVNFNVSQSDIIRLNPQLRERGLHFDELLYIPTGRKVGEKPKVESQEVLPSTPVKVEETKPVVADKTKVESEKPKVESQPAKEEASVAVVEAFVPDTVVAVQDTVAAPVVETLDSIVDGRRVIEIALMLPFESQQTKRSATAARMLEFYQGALLALHESQNDSLLYRLRVYDVERSERRVKALCDSTELDHIQAVLGVVYPIQIKVMSQWCEAHKVPLFLPFCDNMDLKGHPQIYQFNSSDAEEAQVLTRWIQAQDTNMHCVMIETKEADVTNSTRALRKEMKAQGVSYTSLPMRDLLNDSAAYALIPEKENLIIVHSDRIQQVRALLPHLMTLQTVGYRLRLMSQYSWQKENIDMPQVYASKFTTDSTDMSGYNALWSQYFVNEHVSETPRYDLLGYDLMREIVHILNREPGESGLQSPIYWEAETEQDGWQNTYINIVEVER